MIKIIQQKLEKKIMGTASEHEGLYPDKPENIEDLEKRVNEYCDCHTVDIVNIIASGKDNLITFIIKSNPRRRTLKTEEC